MIAFDPQSLEGSLSRSPIVPLLVAMRGLGSRHLICHPHKVMQAHVPPFVYWLTPANGAYLLLPKTDKNTVEHLGEVMAYLRGEFGHCHVPMSHLSGRERWLDTDAPLPTLDSLANKSDNITPDIRATLTNIYAPHIPLDELTDPDADRQHDAGNRLASQWVFGTDMRNRLTAEQQSVFFELLGGTQRAAVRGVAGSGKTILARALARSLAQQGKRVLLLCDTEELAILNNELLAKEKIDCFSTDNIKNLLGKRSLDDVTRLIPSLTQNSPFQNIIDRLLYDALIVDEGQEFSNWKSLERLVRPNEAGTRPLYVFYDPRQHDGPELEMPADLKRFRMELNCRNTLAITRYNSELIDRTIRSRTGMMEGLPPTIHDSRHMNDLIEVGMRQIRKWIENEHAELSQMAILVYRTRTYSDMELPDFLNAGDTRVRLLLDGAPWREGKGVFIGWVDDFRGLEADYVILVIPKGARVAGHYVGASRAREQLLLLRHGASQKY